MYYVATAIVCFGLGVGFSGMVKAGIAKLFTKAETAAKAEVVKGIDDIKAKL